MPRRESRCLVLLVLLLLFPVGASAQSVGIAAVVDTTVTTAATLVKGNNSFRDALSCTNLSATIAVRWGDSTITITKGQRIPAGATIEIRNRGPVYMIAESGSVGMACTEETR